MRLPRRHKPAARNDSVIKGIMEAVKGMNRGLLDLSPDPFQMREGEFLSMIRSKKEL